MILSVRTSVSPKILRLQRVNFTQFKQKIITIPSNLRPLFKFRLFRPLYNYVCSSKRFQMYDRLQDVQLRLLLQGFYEVLLNLTFFAFY